MEEISLGTVHKDIENLKKIVLEMKEHLEDCYLTAEEEIRLEESLKEFKEGKTTSLEELKKELCLN